jgi:cytochrome c
MGPAQAQDAAPEERVQAGALVFKKCAPCHQVGPNANNGIGPVLNGVVGRPAGQYPQYTYSSATKESGMTWDEPALTRYLRAPSKVVPGTRMAFAGLQKDQDLGCDRLPQTLRARRKPGSALTARGAAGARRRGPAFLRGRSCGCEEKATESNRC